MMSHPFRNVFSVSFSFAIVLMVFAGSYSRFFDNNEFDTLDFRFQVRPKINVTDKIALIEIGTDSIERLGRFPFERSYHAHLVKALSEAGAAAIVFDIFFSEPHAQDDELAAAIHQARNVYLPHVFEIDPGKKEPVTSARRYVARTLSDFTDLAKATGHINVIPDADGKFRKIPPYIKYKDTFYPYIAIKMTCDYLGIPEDERVIVPGKYVQLGSDLRIPLDEDSKMIVNFPGKWGTSYHHYSFYEVLQSYIARSSGEKPLLDLDVLKGKICIIGLTAEGTSDLHPTPFEPLYPAVGIHAAIFNSIINRSFITRASKITNIFVLMLLFILVPCTTLATKPLKGFYILLAAASLFVLVCMLLFNVFGIWMDIFYPVLVMVLIYLLCTLLKYFIEWKNRLVMENELQIARQIQESFLPKALPALKGIDIAATMITAKKVGGDLYDFLEWDEGKLGVMVGDVAGKGVPASLFMAMAVSAFKFYAMPDVNPEETLANLNIKLKRESSSSLFVTMFYSIFDLKSKVMTYASGGHNPVLYLAKGGQPCFLDVEDGFPLGVLQGPYSGNQVRFKKGDLFIFYTDGITEAVNNKGQMYGQHRLSDLVRQYKDSSAQEILERLERDVGRFEPRNKQHDDMTAIIIKIV